MTSRAVMKLIRTGSCAIMLCAFWNGCSFDLSRPVTADARVRDGNSTGEGLAKLKIFAPTDDSFIGSSSPDKLYGTYDEIRGLKDYEYRPYLRFNLQGLAGPIQKATVRLYVIDATDNVGDWYIVNPKWSESTISWNNAPTSTGVAIAHVGEVQLNQWMEFDVTASVTDNGVISFVGVPASTDTVKWSSKEGSNPPQLVVEH